MRLICFPYGGASRSAFRDWDAFAPERVEICLPELPGRGGRFREPPLSDIDELVAAMLQNTRPFATQPFAIFGHSMGALVAFEMARRLRDDGLPPAHLFVSSYAGPSKPRILRRVSDLPNDRFLREVRHLVRTSPRAFESPAIFELMLPTLRADIALCERYSYRPGTALRCPITAYGGTEDSSLRFEGLTAWRNETTGPFRVRQFPGDHYYLHAGIRELLGDICSSLVPFGL